MAFKFDLSNLTTRDELERFLGLDPVLEREMFQWVLDYEPPADDEPDPAHELGDELSRVPAPFWRYRIPKRNPTRGFRTVWEAQVLTAHYKALARRLGHLFKSDLAGFPHPSTFGFLGGRNIRENARAHSGRTFLLSTDIEDFFSSITQVQICRLFERLGMVEPTADLLSNFVTIGGRLPLGLATSPILSNAIFLDADVELQQLADERGAVYSRYADDCSFSSNQGQIDVGLVEQCVARHGFRLAHAKTRRSRLGQAHYVTGLSVSDPERPHVPRQMKRRLQQELYYAEKYGLDDHLRRMGVNDRHTVQQHVNRLDGTVKFVAYHEPTLASDLRSQWIRILAGGGRKPAFTPRRQDRPPFHICIDEAEVLDEERRILALGFSVSQAQDRLEAEVNAVLKSYRSDPFAAGDKAALKKKGLHYADASEDLRMKFAEKLELMAVDGFVAFARLGDDVEYESTYLALLSIMLRRRLIHAESEKAIIVVEKNSKVSSQAIRAAIDTVFADLAANNNQRPRAIEVQFVSKPHAGVSIPDFLLGVLGRYLKSSPGKPGKSEARDRLMFERLRDKYRLILDLDTGDQFTRRWEIKPWK